MNNSSPLDADLSFENERPAGAYLEAQLHKAAFWAKRLALGIWLFLCYEVYVLSDFQAVTLLAYSNFLSLVISWLVPLGILSYYIWRFGKLVSEALRVGDQSTLEKGFRQLRYVLITALIVGGYNVLEYVFFSLKQI